MQKSKVIFFRNPPINEKIDRRDTGSYKEMSSIMADQ